MAANEFKMCLVLDTTELDAVLEKAEERLARLIEIERADKNQSIVKIAAAAAMTATLWDRPVSRRSLLGLGWLDVV